MPEPEMGTVPTLTGAIDEAQRILEERGKQYGPAWLITGQVLSYLDTVSDLRTLMQSGFFYNWLIILNKLIRAIASPFEPDHWVDMQNYAALVHRHITTGKT